MDHGRSTGYGSDGMAMNKGMSGDQRSKIKDQTSLGTQVLLTGGGDAGEEAPLPESVSLRVCKYGRLR